MASENFNLLDYHSREGNMALKIDIKKAFDSMEWDFILEVLSCFGFSSLFYKWIHAIIISTKLSIIINGSPRGYFSCSRGLRQEDPLSPLLFCLAEEFLNRSLLKIMDNQVLSPMHSNSRV